MPDRYGKVYARLGWKNKTEPALNDTNLNKMDYALNEVDNRTIELDSIKLNLTEANGMITGFAVNEKTGIITVTYYSGATKAIPTNLNQITMNWDFDKKSQKIIFYLESGDTKEVDLSSFITNYEFVDSDTVCFIINEDGTVSADIKKGAITEDKLQPNFLADIRLEAAKAEQARKEAETAETSAQYYSNLAMSYTNGLSGIREGENTDCAKYYKEKAEEAAVRAEQVSDISFATQEKAGIVKPDGTTITVDEDGTLHGANTVEVDGQTIEKTGDNVLKVADAVLNRLDGLSDSNETLSEYVSERVDGIWDQFGKVDNELDKLKYNTETTFGEAAERENIASGERLPVILGKIKKWFSDLKAVAFTGSYNDLTDKPSISEYAKGVVDYNSSEKIEIGYRGASLDSNDVEYIACYKTGEKKIKDATFSTVKGKMGLGNVDNTSDADKPVSVAQKDALDKKMNKDGGTMTGTLHMDAPINFANSTWNAVGDDAYIGDHNVGGGVGIKGREGTNTRLDFVDSNNDSNYKSIIYDGTTLHIDGICVKATSDENGNNIADTYASKDNSIGLHPDVSKEIMNNFYNELELGERSISTLRTDRTVDGLNMYGAGIAFRTYDTFGYINVNHNNTTVYVGGGNGAGINWHRRLLTTDDLETGSGVKYCTVQFAQGGGGEFTTQISLTGRGFKQPPVVSFRATNSNSGYYFDIVSCTKDSITVRVQRRYGNGNDSDAFIAYIIGI